MLFNLFALTICFFTIIVLFIRNVNLLSPIFLTAVPWFLVFLTGIFVYDDFYPIADDAKLSWFIWYSISVMIFFILSVKNKVTNLETRKFRIIRFNYIYILVLLILWLIYRIWIVGTTGPEHFLLNLRLSSNELEGFETLGLVGRFYPLIFSLFVFELCFKSESNKNRIFLLWIWMLLYAFATMGKFSLLTPFLAWIVILSFQKKIKVKYLLYLFTLLFTAMMFMHFFRASSDDSTTLYQVISIYLYSPIVALGNLSPSTEFFGMETFRFFYALFYSFSISNIEPIKVILEYVNIPFPTNVYTIIRPYYNDFGLFGVFLGSIFFSLFFGIIFRLASKNIYFFQMYYAMLSIIILAQFLGDLFMSSLSSHIQLFICLLFVFLISKKEYREY